MPVGPDIQYTSEKPGAPITLLVFTGADGDFALYEDDGVSYQYEKGQFSYIPMRYDAAKSRLTIGARTGSYTGMPEERTFRIRWIKAQHAVNIDATLLEEFMMHEIPLEQSRLRHGLEYEVGFLVSVE